MEYELFYTIYCPVLWVHSVSEKTGVFILYIRFHIGFD